MHRRGRGILRRRQIDRHREHMLRLESQLDRAQLRKAPRDQSGTRKKYECEGNLGHHEHAAEHTSSAADRAPSLADGCRQIPLARLKRRQEPEADPGEEAQRGGEREHEPIDVPT